MKKYKQRDYYSEKVSLITIKRKNKKEKTLIHSKSIWIIIILDFIILTANIYFLFKRKDNINIDNFKKNNLFKNIDNFTFEKATDSYENIVNYLNNKYLNNNNNKLKKSNSTETKEKKKIVIYFLDLYNRKYRENWIKSALEDKFIIEFDSEKPDYVFYNIFGCDHLKSKYKDAIKIAHFTENQIVDLNMADYAIGQHHISYLDRYFRRPFFIFQLVNYTNANLTEIRQKVLDSPIRKKFCAAVISNTGWTDGFRRLFYKELNKYKEIDMGGGYHNNVGGPVHNKKKFLESYKFSLAMENTKADGYLTEKIVDAFLAGNIPIYYGDYMVEEYINPKAFILIKGEKDMMEKIEYIKKIDNDDELYKKILKEKVLINDKIIEDSTSERIRFLTHIFEQNKTLAKRVDNYHWKKNKHKHK